MWSLKLAKEAFKFSGAHFTTFSQTEAELLHGHNYYVRVSLNGCSELTHGLIIDLNEPKKAIKSLLDQIDEKVLLAQKNPYTQIKKSKSQIEVFFNEKIYSFPEEDCALIPVENITIEALSSFVAEALKESFSNYPIESYSVEISESRGQSCVFTQKLEKKR